MVKGGGEQGTPGARALLKWLRRDFLDDPNPDGDKQEVARDLVSEEPSIVYPLRRLVEDNDSLTMEQRSVIAGFAVDILIENTHQKKIFECCVWLALEFLLQVSENPELIEPGGRVHFEVAGALAAVNGDLDAQTVYFDSIKKTRKALRALREEVEKD